MSRISFQDFFRQCGLVKEEPPKKQEKEGDDELTVAVRQIAALLQTQYGASVKWSFDCESPVMEIREKNFVPIRINGERGRAIYRFGMISSVEKLPKGFKEVSDDDVSSFSFVEIAKSYFKSHEDEIAKMAAVAKAKNFESIVISPELAAEALDPLCSILVSDGNYIGARIRRKTRILIALKADAMYEKKRTARDVKRAEGHKSKPEHILKTQANDYVASRFSEIMEIAENARANGKDFFRLKPKIDTEALPFLVDALRAKGYLKVNRDKKSVIVRLNDLCVDDSGKTSEVPERN